MNQFSAIKTLHCLPELITYIIVVRSVYSCTVLGVKIWIFISYKIAIDWQHHHNLKNSLRAPYNYWPITSLLRTETLKFKNFSTHCKLSR